jgi:hypothetical protein
VISVSMFMCAELVGAAALALWVVARYPRLGPKSLRSAIVLVIAAFTVLRLSTLSQASLVGMPHGAYVLLFGSVLPSFFVAFLATAWLMRILAGAFGGSGGGGGHRVPADSRS